MDIIYRIVLKRTVAAVEAKDSGIAVGEHYKVPSIAGSTPVISQNSAFTALYVIKQFVPGNYTAQKLKWGANNTQTYFPQNTKITLLKLSADEQNTVEEYWYYKVQGTNVSEVDLNQFVRMGGTDTYLYDSSSTGATTVKYLIVVNLEETNLTENTYQLIFAADTKDGATVFNDIGLSVQVKKESAYNLTSVAGSGNADQPSDKVTYTVSKSDGNESYLEGKTLALVLTEGDTGSIPSDAKIQVQDQLYTRNVKGQYIIPLGTIQDGTIEMTLQSEMFPDRQRNYSFTAELYLVNSTVSAAPMNGQCVATCDISFNKAEKKRPALRVTGTKHATKAEWISGQDLEITIQNVPENGSVTVTAYKGITETTKVTDMLSSVCGMFTVKDGVGTYVSANTSTGKLVLSNSIEAGTYRLVFEVKDGNGNIVLTVPYYFIVQ